MPWQQNRQRDPEDVALERWWARNEGLDPRADGGNPAFGDGDLQQESADRLYRARVAARRTREARDGAR